MHCLSFQHIFPPALPLFNFCLDFVLSQYSSLNFEMTYFKFQLFFVFVIIEQLISLLIWIKIKSLSSDSSLTSIIHQSITTMDIDDRTDDSGQNLMYQKMMKFVAENILKSSNMIQVLKTLMQVVIKSILEHLISLLLL